MHAFRMSKSDLQARPIFHHSHDAIRAHVLICFMALMIGKYIEIKTGHSLRPNRNQQRSYFIHQKIQKFFFFDCSI